MNELHLPIAFDNDKSCIGYKNETKGKSIPMKNTADGGTKKGKTNRI